MHFSDALYIVCAWVLVLSLDDYRFFLTLKKNWARIPYVSDEGYIEFHRYEKLLNVMHRTRIFYNSLIYGSLLDYNNFLAGQSYSNFAICFYFSKSACYKQAVLRSCLVFPRLSWGQNKLINNDFPSWTMVTTPCQIAKELQTTWNKKL